MDGNQIRHVLSSDPFTKTVFEGVFPSDRLRHLTPTTPSALVVNTDPSSRPGSHWIAIFISKDRKGSYFDSYGLPPSKNIAKFLNRHCKQQHYNTRSVQGLFSTVCGQYAIFYLLHMSRGWDMSQIVGWFTKEPYVNDELVNGFIEKYFPCIDQPIYDTKFLNQIAKARH